MYNVQINPLQSPFYTSIKELLDNTFAEQILKHMSKKVILITGTNSGFGWLAVNTCAALGYKVYATMRDIKGRNADRAKALARHENIEVVDLDVTDGKSVIDTVAAIIKKEGRMDVLVNNAGIYAIGIAETFTEKDVEKIMDVDVVGTWRTMKAVLPQMRKQREGLIINISSVAGRFSFPFQTVYNGAKFAVEGLTEGLHYEVRPLGVDVVMIQPGAFPTEVWGKIVTGSDATVIAGYGDLAKVPEQIGAGIGQMFETLKPNPQLVADVIVKLISTPHGKRPLRTVVDPATGNFSEVANKHVKEQYDNFLTAFGMQAMLD
jgi:NAD(P)-dependent dehydrogenase (short-subunit alcohol dehydrogenase family)